MSMHVMPIVREAMKDEKVVLVRPLDKMVCCFLDGGIDERIIIEFDEHHEATGFYWVRPGERQEGKPPTRQMDVFEWHLRQLIRDCARSLQDIESTGHVRDEK